MPTIRQIYESSPDVISIPTSLRRRRVEVIILPLDEVEAQNEELDENGYPPGFFEETFGSIPDLTEREPQPEQIRKEL